MRGASHQPAFMGSCLTSMAPYDWANGGSVNVSLTWWVWNEMKYILFNIIYIDLQQLQVIPEKKNTRKTYKVPNIHENSWKKYKENKIVKECLRWINLWVVSRDKCNNGIKRENPTGNLSIINRA